MPHHHRLTPERRGAAALETALVLIPFVLLVFGIFEFGRYVMVKQLMVNAGRSGARLASVNTDVNGTAQNKTTGEIQQHVIDRLAGQPIANLAVQIYHADDAGVAIPPSGPTDEWAASATYQHKIAVEITGDYLPLLPTWGLLSNNGQNSVPIRTKSVTHSEGR